MRLPRARFTIRRMMIAVAVLAILLGAISESGRVVRWGYYARGEREHLRMAIEVENRRGTTREQPLDNALVADIRRIATEQAARSMKHRPQIVGIACMIMTLAGLAMLPLILGFRLVSRLWKRIAIETPLPRP